MKAEILKISKQLESDEITYREARRLLCALFEVQFKPKVSGLAKVKEDSNYVYKGLTLSIVGIDITFQNGNGHGSYPDGTSNYILSLKGTEFSERKYTVIHEKYLEILELKED